MRDVVFELCGDKLVDRHEEGQGNPTEEVAIDKQKVYVVGWSSQLLPPLHSRFFV